MSAAVIPISPTTISSVQATGWEMMGWREGNRSETRRRAWAPQHSQPLPGVYTGHFSGLATLLSLVCLRLGRHLLIGRVNSRRRRGREVTRNSVPLPLPCILQSWPKVRLGGRGPMGPPHSQMTLGKSLCLSRCQFHYLDSRITSPQRPWLGVGVGGGGVA